MLKVPLFIALLLLFLGIACAAPSPTLPPFNDSANLAVHPDIETVVIGQVLEELGEEIVQRADSPTKVRYGYWLFQVDEYLVNPFPYSVLKVRIIKEFVRPDGSTAPVLYPLPGLAPPGEKIVFFLSRYSNRSEKPLTGDTFANIIGSLGHQTQLLIRNGQVQTHQNGTLVWEPLEDFVARVVRVASRAGLETGE